MFKKRLKGLLAMVLAGSIATTTLPLSASATIDGDISVVGGIGGNINSSDIEGGLSTYNAYLTADNLWAIHNNAGYYHCAGDELQSTLQRYYDVPSLVSDIKIRYSHDILFTTKDITGGTAVTRGDMDKCVSVSSFPYNISYAVSLPVDPLMEISWTAWYNSESENTTNESTYQYTNSNSTKSSTFVDQTSTQISADVIKDLYQGSNEEPITCGKTIIELKTAYKTFNLPVLNTVLQPEMNGSTPKTVPITQGSSGDIDGYLESFYLCYIDRTNDIVKISDDTMSTKSEVWNKLGGFISGIANYDESNLCLVRSVTATVFDSNSEIGDFTTKDFIIGNTAGNTALKYLYVDAPDKSIWKVVPNGSDKCFFATKDKIVDAIKSCLTYKPKASMITFTEQTTIYVTGTTPTAGGSIASENRLLTQILKDDSLKTISVLLAELAEAIPPASGKKYDVNGWELWSADTYCGSLIDLQKINFNTSGVTGVTADMFDKAGSKRPVIYFPQVDDTSSGGGNSSGGSSSSREPSYDPDKPMIDGEEKSWSDVARDIGKLAEGETKTITLGRDKKIPADVMQAIMDSKAVITFRINSAFSWTVDGSTLTDGDIHDYDFSIEVVTATGTEILRGNVGTSFIIGDITGKATLNINFKEGHEQEFANLYKKVDGELVFVDNVRIDENGAAIGLEVSEAGEYVVMLGEFSDRPGDMDNDGIMNPKDATAVLNDFVEIERGSNPFVSDMNKDGFINPKDAMLILNKFVGIE